MKKVIIKVAVSYLILSVLLVSCAKEPVSTTKTVKSELPTIKKERIWQWIVVAVIIIVAETTGQKTTTTTTLTTTDGTGTHTNTTVTSKCDGLGVCAGSICINPNSGNGSLDLNDQSFDLHTDLRVNAKLAVTQSNDIILLVEDGQNTDEVKNKFFYGEYLYFMPDGYTVNNPNVLQSLGLNAPFRIIGANYPVYQQENMKYIIVGHKS